MRTPTPPRLPAEPRIMALLDRLIGDALIGALLVLGFAFCIGAARAAGLAG